MTIFAPNYGMVCKNRILVRNLDCVAGITPFSAFSFLYFFFSFFWRVNVTELIKPANFGLLQKTPPQLGIGAL